MVSEISHSLLVLFPLGMQWREKDHGKYVEGIKLLTWRLGSNVKWRGSQYSLWEHTSNDLTFLPLCQCSIIWIEPQTAKQGPVDLFVELTLLEYTGSVCKFCLSQESWVEVVLCPVHLRKQLVFLSITLPAFAPSHTFFHFYLISLFYWKCPTPYFQVKWN